MAKHNQGRADETRRVAHEVGDLLAHKQSAYGDVASLQLGLWTVLLAQYRRGNEYVIPVELMDHIPRLTRVFDRIGRIVANPAQDEGGEDPWRDLAGDALVGVVMPRTKQAAFSYDAELRAGAALDGALRGPQPGHVYPNSGGNMADAAGHDPIEAGEDIYTGASEVLPRPGATRVWNEGRLGELSEGAPRDPDGKRAPRPVPPATFSPDADPAPRLLTDG